MVKGINYNMMFISDDDAVIKGNYGITPADVLNDTHLLIIRVSPVYNEDDELVGCNYSLVTNVSNEGEDGYTLYDIGERPFARSFDYNEPFVQAFN